MYAQESLGKHCHPSQCLPADTIKIHRMLCCIVPADSHHITEANFLLELISTAINQAVMHQQAPLVGYEGDLGISARALQCSEIPEASQSLSRVQHPSKEMHKYIRNCQLKATTGFCVSRPEPGMQVPHICSPNTLKPTFCIASVN